MEGADTRVFFWINGLAGRLGFLDRVMEVVVSDYFIPVLMSVALLGLWFVGRSLEERDRLQRAVIVAASGGGWANLIVMVVNDHYFRLRPFAALQDVHLLFYRPIDSSFPSNPAAVTFAIAMGIWLWNKRLGSVFFGMALLLGFSRVYAGVHYPLDVVGGALVGIVTCYAFHRVLMLIEPIPTLVLKVMRVLHLA